MLAESFPKSMVKRKALEKLSNIELEKYIKPESRFVADAIEIAYEILKSRGRTFTEKENEQIQSLIQTKKDSEPKYDEIKNNGWDKNYTEDENAIELYTNKLIWIYCLLVGVIFGSFLQVYNFIKLNPKRKFDEIIHYIKHKCNFSTIFKCKRIYSSCVTSQ